MKTHLAVCVVGLLTLAASSAAQTTTPLAVSPPLDPAKSVEVGPTWRSCRASPACEYAGRCTAGKRQCLAALDEDCVQAEVCAQRGRCKAKGGRCVTGGAPPPRKATDVVAVRAWERQQVDWQPPDAPTTRRKSDVELHLEMLPTLGIGQPTGEGSGNVLDPGFYTAIAAGLRVHSFGIHGRFQYSPLNIEGDTGSGSLLMVGAYPNVRLGPRDGGVDVLLGASLGYFYLEVAGPAGRGSADGLQLGPSLGLLIQATDWLAIGPLVEYQVLIASELCFNGYCRDATDESDDGFLSGGLTVSLSLDMASASETAPRARHAPPPRQTPPPRQEPPRRQGPPTNWNDAL